MHRLDEGFDLVEAVTELGMLRDCILGLWQDETLGPLHTAELRTLDHALDVAMVEAVRQFTASRERSLAAIDRVVTAALESTDLEELLQRLLAVLLETTPAIDTTAILLREDNRMVVRAAVGLDRELEKGFEVEFGEGFAGAIAATGQPLSLRMASKNPMIKSPMIRRLGLQALYGVPLLDRGRVIGVAHIGSLTAPDFSVQDKRLFAAVAVRATTAIVQHVLRGQAERATAELRERELQLRSLADTIPQLAWMADAGGRVFWVNRRWLVYTGMAAADMQGEGLDRLLHPDHVGAVRAKREQAMFAGTAWDSTHPLRGVDGRFRWFHCSSMPIHDETGAIVRWLTTCSDITERRFLDEATTLLSSTLEYRDTLERVAELAVPDLADWCTVDLLVDEEIVRVAVAHPDPAKRELARDFAKRFPDPADTGVHRVIATGTPTFAPVLTPQMVASTVRNPEQREILMQLGLRSAIIVPLTARGRVLGAITLLMSDSQRQYQQGDVDIALELGRRAGIAVDNARLYHEAQQAVRLREDVLAVVSHDLRNPLGAIDLSASMMLQKNHDPRTRKQIDIIRRSAIRMEHLITDLLDMASIQAGRLALERGPHDAGALIAEVVEMHASLAAEKQVLLTSRTTLDGVMIQCDRERIVQVFGNLVSNAIKFCRPGDRIEIAGKSDGARATFTVRDTGPGIAADALPHIFEPYWSAKQHAKQGTGLGLYISKGIVEAHGGTLAAESTPGAGATFTITLPLA
jgi:PAS domain S-box-containing protein